MNTAILITARLKSVRLPMKVIKSIEGRPMICHMVDRLKLSKKSNRIIISTSDVEQDDPLVEIAEQENIDCFRGAPLDVLMRMKNAAKTFNVDTIISCSADNPFVDPVYIDKLVSFHHADRNDYTNISGLPFGVFSHAIAFNALDKVCRIKDEENTEGWGAYFTQTGFFKCGTLVVDDPEIYWPELRLTVDYPEDFKVVKAIFDKLYDQGHVFSLHEIVRFCRDHPEVTQINESMFQKPLKAVKLKKNS